MKSDRFVELPLHLWWSGPRVFDLADAEDRRRVYELVLREGTAEDIRTWITRDGLRDELEHLTIPEHVRTVWTDVLSVG